MVDGMCVVAMPNCDLSRCANNSIVHATGDIDGRLDLLEILVDVPRVAVGVASRNERVTAAFLSDYVDRGPDSRGELS